MPLQGYTEKRSKCCNALLEYSGFNEPFSICSECKKGRWPSGVEYRFVYVPSDYEMQLEQRIKALEELISELEVNRTNI